MVKFARPLLVAALLAAVGACAPKPEPAVMPVAALPEAPPTPMMGPPIGPPPSSHVAHSSQKRLSAVKKHKHEHKVASKNGKSVKVAKHSKKKKKNHTKVAKASSSAGADLDQARVPDETRSFCGAARLAGAGSADDSGPECADSGPGWVDAGYALTG